jgi:hypothetical protein
VGFNQLIDRTKLLRTVRSRNCRFRYFGLEILDSSSSSLEFCNFEEFVCRGRGGYEQRVGLVWLESFEDALTFPAQVILLISVAEPGHFLRLRPHVGNNFGSGSSLSQNSAPVSTIFSIYFRKKFKKFTVSKNVMLFKTKNYHQKVLKNK